MKHHIGISELSRSIGPRGPASVSRQDAFCSCSWSLYRLPIYVKTVNRCTSIASSAHRMITGRRHLQYQHNQLSEAISLSHLARLLDPSPRL
eukprot:2457598-Pleurochrysis_carterae.AAC.2